MTDTLRSVTSRSWFPTAVAVVVGVLAYGPGVSIQIAAEHPKFYPIELLGVVAVVMAVLSFRRNAARPVPFTTITMLSVWVVFVVASIFGAEPLLSLGIARVTALAAGIAWAVPAWTAGVDRWRFVSIVVIAGTLFHGFRLIDTLVTLTGGEIRVWIQIRDGVSLLAGSLNAATSILVASLPFLLIAIVRQKGWVRWTAMASVVVSVGLITESQSRSVALAMYAAIALWAVGLVIRSDRMKVVPALIGVLAIVAGFWFGPGGGGTQIVTAVNAVVPSIGGGEPVLDEDFPFDGLEPEIDSEGDWERRNNWSDLHRSELWETALDEFKEYPVLGNGFRERPVDDNPDNKGFAHNTFLELLAATGILGTLTFVAAWLAYAIGWIRDWRSWQFEKVTLAGAITAGFAIGMVQPFFLTGHVFAVVVWLAASVPVSAVGEDS